LWKWVVSGDTPGFQIQWEVLIASLVGSIPMHFRHFQNLNLKCGSVDQIIQNKGIIESR
jgi:hypothetical protein